KIAGGGNPALFCARDLPTAAYCKGVPPPACDPLVALFRLSSALSTVAGQQDVALPAGRGPRICALATSKGQPTRKGADLAVSPLSSGYLAAVELSAPDAAACPARHPIPRRRAGRPSSRPCSARCLPARRISR